MLNEAGACTRAYSTLCFCALHSFDSARLLGAETGAREPQYILVREALLSGMSNRWWTTEGEACKRAQYSALRDHAWSIYGIQPKAARKPADRIRMTFLIKAESDRRQMLVGPEVLDAVRTNFPQIDIDLQVASAQEQSVQLRWLAETDIFVSNIGSASFRMLYLPDGAQVRLLAPCDRIDMQSRTLSGSKTCGPTVASCRFVTPAAQT